MPRDHETLTLLQVHAAKEIGGVNTRMLLDAPQEVLKYHFGPLQIALALLFAIIEKYRQLSKAHPVFRDDAVDQYCRENHQFVENLEALRNSIVRQRYDNMDEQEKFVKEFSGGKTDHLVTLLIEGESVYRDYLKRLWRSLNKDGRNESLARPLCCYFQSTADIFHHEVQSGDGGCVVASLIIEPSNYKKKLGFLGVALGKEQLDVHNRSVTLIVVALLHQSLENYFDLTRIDPRLEDPSLQDFSRDWEAGADS